jgi:DnaJ family protein B protein 4
MGGGQTFHFGNADEIFKNFFGTSDPFQAQGSGSDDEAGFSPFGGMGGGGMGGMGGMGGRGFPGGMGGEPVHHLWKSAVVVLC